MNSSNKLTRDRVLKYIEVYFKHKYPISDVVQPHFWDAVVLLCENPDTEDSELGITEMLAFCVYKNNRFSHIKGLCKDGVTALAKKIAKEIEEIDSTPIDPLEFLSVKAELDKTKSEFAKYRRKHG